MSNNTLSSDCLTPDQLQRLLNGSVTPDEERRWTEHLSQCAVCRAALEACTPDDLADRARRSLSAAEPMPSVLTSLLEQTAADVRDSLADSPASTPTWADIEPWLEPVDDGIGRVGPYRLTKLLGRGGMGVVFLGHDSELNRPVAVKLLSPSLMADDTARRRFLREAQAVAAIHHPSIVAIHRVEADHKLPWFAMEYIAGRSLEQHLTDGTRFSPRQVVKIGFQVATALAAAHDAQLIHRDIKPGNILIEKESGRVRLMDFGLARDTSSTQLTATGTLLGTPWYMAPETVAERPQDHRTDLFALGAVLYHLLAGTPPFEANTVVGVIRAISAGNYRRLTATSDRTSSGLIRVVDKLLESKPDQRFQRASDVAAALRDVSRGVDEARPRFSTGVLAAVVSGVIILAVLLWQLAPDTADMGSPGDSIVAADRDAPAGSAAADAAQGSETPTSADSATAERAAITEATFELWDAEGRLTGSAATLPLAIEKVADGGTVQLPPGEVWLEQSLAPGDKSITLNGPEEGVDLWIELDEAGPAFTVEDRLQLNNLRIRQQTDVDDADFEDVSIVAMDGGKLICEGCQLEQSEGALIWINEEADLSFTDCGFFIPAGSVVRSSSSTAAREIEFVGCRLLCSTALSLEPQLPRRVMLTDCELVGEHVAVLETDDPETDDSVCELEVVDCVLCVSLSICHLVARSSLQEELERLIWHGENNVSTAPLLLLSNVEDDEELIDRTDDLLTRDGVNVINPARVAFDDVEAESDFDIARLQDPEQAADAFREVIDFLRRRTGRDHE